MSFGDLLGSSLTQNAVKVEHGDDWESVHFQP